MRKRLTGHQANMLEMKRKLSSPTGEIVRAEVKIEDEVSGDHSIKKEVKVGAFKRGELREFTIVMTVSKDGDQRVVKV
ncbi:hypothetical protein LIER_26046 [Lithospermum erythrorhizon]|uniref:Uncharacterized protein n=1 Tax=Lithospermum erythrorhizon TaxID=34254 RepID=A0AAV3RCU9_LITER